MKERYLEVTFRKGHPLAAYLYLPRVPGTRSARTESAGDGLLIDYGADGHAIGVEITDPRHVTSEALNRVMHMLGLGDIEPDELTPLQAA